MLLEDIKNISSTPRDVRNFGLTIGIVLGIIGGVLWWFGRPAYPFFLGVGTVLVLLGLGAPGILKPLQKGWMAIAVVLGWIMTRVILFIFFFLVFTLVGIFGRLFGKRFLTLRANPNTRSQWNYRKPQPYDRQKTEMQF